MNFPLHTKGEKNSHMSKGNLGVVILKFCGGRPQEKTYLIRYDLYRH